MNEEGGALMMACSVINIRWSGFLKLSIKVMLLIKLVQ